MRSVPCNRLNRTYIHPGYWLCHDPKFLVIKRLTPAWDHDSNFDPRPADSKVQLNLF